MGFSAISGRFLAAFSLFSLFALSYGQGRYGNCQPSDTLLTFDEIANSAASGRQDLPSPWTYPNTPFTFTQPPVPSWWEGSLFQLLNKNAIQPPDDLRAVACASSSPNCFEVRYPAPTVEITVVPTQACPRPQFDVVSFRYYLCPIDNREFNITTYAPDGTLLTKIQKPAHAPDTLDKPFNFQPSRGDKAWQKLGKLVLSVGSQPFRTGGRFGAANGLYLDDLKFRLRCNC
ncbi:hypothetical protein DFP73DRAFT_537521 [Morchella snyderi]|nr:hypothetical protein DFP73DRAFT_537521 [Morchella snyderi]